mmetsp:Transcript_101262/g.290529  ORF Transcript_101262/g.290529 Transcript_101262/m.290529 type:complete len:130 (+) Transcript_101262:421-810(+)
MWEGAGEKFRPFPWREHERERHNKPKDAATQKKVNAQLLRGESKKRQRLKALGIDYSFPGYSSSRGGSAEADAGEQKSQKEDEEIGHEKREEKQEEAKAPTPTRVAKKGSRKAAGSVSKPRTMATKKRR